MNSTGLRPESIGVELRLGRVGKENVATKARRLLIEGRVQVRRLDSQGVLSHVRGDSGVLRTVTYEAGLWSCDCPYRGACSHVMAVQAVVVVAE